MAQKQFVPPVIVGICGGSGSGKTTFCDRFVSLLGRDRVLHLKQDDYYRDYTGLSYEDRCQINFDHPDSIEFPLMAEHLDLLAAGYEVSMPRYDFSSHSRIPAQDIVSPRPVIVVEGILIFADEQVSTRLQHKVFIDACEKTRFERRLRRDVRDRGRSPESVEWQFQTTVKPMHEKFVDGNKGRADRIISGEQPFEPVIAELCKTLVQQYGLFARGA